MEKLKNFVVNFGQEIIYLLFFALFFIFGLIGLFQVEINEVAYQLNLYFLIGGGYIGEIYFSCCCCINFFDFICVLQAF